MINKFLLFASMFLILLCYPRIHLCFSASGEFNQQIGWHSMKCLVIRVYENRGNKGIRCIASQLYTAYIYVCKRKAGKLKKNSYITAFWEPYFSPLACCSKRCELSSVAKEAPLCLRFDSDEVDDILQQFSFCFFFSYTFISKLSIIEFVLWYRQRFIVRFSFNEGPHFIIITL